MKALKARQIGFFYAAILPVAKFFMMPSLVSGISGEDLWLSVLINCVLDILTVTTVYFCMKDYDCDFFTLLERRCGKAFAKVVAVFYIIFFLLKTFMPLSEEKDYVELTLYMTSPSLLTFMPVFAVLIFICAQRLRVIGRIADGVLVIAITGYAFTFALSVSNTDISALLPVGAQGAENIVYGAYRSQAWFADGAYFLFFAGEYVKGKRDGLKIISAVCVSALIVLTFTVIFYGTFGPIAFRQKFALTEISKYTSVINNVERFDYLSIFALLFVSIFSLAMPFYFATELLTRLFPLRRAIAACLCALPSAALLLFFDEYFTSVENFIFGIASGYFAFFGFLFPTVTAVILKITDKKEKQIVQRC